MANEEHLAILRQGVDAWNAWKQEHPHIVPDLRAGHLRGADLFRADLSRAILEGAILGWTDFNQAGLGGANLREANLRGANLSEAKLGGTNLVGAELSKANLNLADLHSADLSGAILEGAALEAASLVRTNLSLADLSGANLRRASLLGAILRKAHLSGANLQRANLVGAEFREADLSDADLSDAELYETVFLDLDLSATKGLDGCEHWGPSVIDHRTLQRSGRLPLAFLRGCGLSDWQIEAAKLHETGLTSEQIENIVYRIHDLRSTRPIQIHNLFISYSHAAGVFLDHMEKHLQERGILFWRDKHDASAGPAGEDRRSCHAAEPDGVACALGELGKERLGRV